MPKETHDEWLERKGFTKNGEITEDARKKYFSTNTDFDENAIKTVEDLVVVVSFGREFYVNYKDLRGFVSPCDGPNFCIATSDGKYKYETNDLDEVEEKGTFGPYFLRDIINELEYDF